MHYVCTFYEHIYFGIEPTPIVFVPGSFPVQSFYKKDGELWSALSKSTVMIKQKDNIYFCFYFHI